MTTLPQPEHIFELVNDSVMTRTMEGKINFWNRSAEELYGWRREEAIGRVSHDLLQTQFPKPLEEIESELVRNGRWEGKLVHTTREGGRVVVESRWTLELKGQLGALLEINTRSTHLGAGTDTCAVEVGRQEPLPTSKMRVDDLLPKVANILLAGGAFLCILVSFYFIYYYGWTAQRHFTAPFGMVLYVVFPVVLASLLFAFLRRSLGFKVNSAFVCVSLIASAYGGELFLRLIDFPLSGPRKPAVFNVITSKEKEKEAAKLTKKFGVEIDARGGFEVIADLRKRGIDAVPIITPSNNLFVKEPDGSIKSAINIHGNEVMPLGAISNKFTVLCNENGSWVTYESDEHGFYNPGGTWKSSRVDIAALGDSFPHGYCVPPDENFVALIRQRYPATLNVGMAGNGPLLMLATLKEYLPLYRPKVVLWFYFEGNDLIDLQTEKQSAILMRYLKDDFNQDLLTRQNDIDQALTNDIDREEALEKANQARQEKNSSTVGDTLWEFIKLTNLRQQLSLVYGIDAKELEKLSDLDGPNMDLFHEILSQAKSRVRAWGGTLYFVYLPGFARYDNYYDMASEKRPRIINLVRMLDIPLIDIDPAFQAQEDPLSLFPFREPGHYNEKGHQLVAEEVLKSISPGEPGER